MLTAQSSMAAAPTQAPMFRGGVDLVTMSVVVHDHNRRPVTALTPNAFELLDAGEVRPILDVRSAPSPISVAVLFDVSGSMDVGPKLPAARDAVSQLMAWLVPGSDQAALFVFDTKLNELQAFTATPADVVGHLDTLWPFGATSLYDAIAETGRRLVAHLGAARAAEAALAAHEDRRPRGEEHLALRVELGPVARVERPRGGGFGGPGQPILTVPVWRS